MLTGDWLWWLSADAVDGVTMAIVGGVASLYLHETAHYTTYDLLGFDPTFVWPSMVIAADQFTKMNEKVAVFLAPQLLNIAYIGTLILSSEPTIKILMAWMFILNLSGGVLDILWSVYWVRWPDETIAVTTSEGVGYVAFPKSTS
jgi:hypothetical protein